MHIVESPSSWDLLDGRTEGRALSESLQLAGIRHRYSHVTNHETLAAALGERLAAAVSDFQGARPVVHFSAHGCDDGIQLTNGVIVSWAELGHLLRPVHSHFEHGTLVCLSSCKGYSGIRMAMTTEPANTFWALVAHMGQPTWSDACVGFIAFYNRFFKGHDPLECVKAMRAATGDDQFVLELGTSVRANWNTFITQAGTWGSLGGLGGLGGLPPELNRSD